MTEEDGDNAQTILGLDIWSLKGKMVKGKAEHVNLSLSAVPSELIRRSMEVTIFFDLMNLNEITFMVSIARDIKFYTAEEIGNHQEETIMESLEKIKATYGWCSVTTY